MKFKNLKKKKKLTDLASQVRVKKWEGLSFNCEVHLKAQICACELVTNNSNNVIFRRMCKIINVN